MTGAIKTALGRIYELPGSGGARLQSMEGLRAYAALLVFAVHYLDPYIRTVHGVDPNTLDFFSVESPGLMVAYFLFASHYGVDIFFILSGYLIFGVVTRTGFSYRPFILRRLARVYPAALAALAIWAVLRVEVQGWYDWEAGQVIGNLLFLNAVPELDVVPYNTVTWSLFFELLFYSTFPVVLLMARAPGRVSPRTVLVLGVVVVLSGWMAGGGFIRFAMFFAGALLASLGEERQRAVAAGIPTAVVLLGFLASAVLFASTLNYNLFVPVFAVTGSLFVLHVLHGGGVLSRTFAATPLRWLGNVSYSFYLVHGLAIQIVMYRFHDLFLSLPPALHLISTLLSSLTLSVVFATALFVLVEKPYFSLGNRHQKRHESRHPDDRRGDGPDTRVGRPGGAVT